VFYEYKYKCEKENNKNTNIIVLNICFVMLFCMFCVVPSVCLCTVRFVMVPLTLTYLQCLKHIFFDNFFSFFSLLNDITIASKFKSTSTTWPLQTYTNFQKPYHCISEKISLKNYLDFEIHTHLLNGCSFISKTILPTGFVLKT